MDCLICDYANDDLKRFSDHLRSAHGLTSEQYTVERLCGEVTALCCMVGSYSEATQLLVGAGATPEVAETYILEGAPATESYVYRSLKPWLEHFASGGTCQHVGGHIG